MHSCLSMIIVLQNACTPSLFYFNQGAKPIDRDSGISLGSRTSGKLNDDVV